MIDLVTGDFTPTEAGKYFFCAHVQITGDPTDMAVSDFLVLVLMKNGSKHHESAIRYSASDHEEGPTIACIAEANGTDDNFQT